MLTKVCCFRLKTAGVILGWLGIVGAFTSAILCAIVLGQSDTLVNLILSRSDNPNMTFALVLTVLMIAVGLSLAVSLLNLLASGFLVLGTMKDRHLMLVPWLTFYGMDLGISILYFFSLWFVVEYPAMFGVAIIFGLVLALKIYLYYVIYSLYKQIQRACDQKLQLSNVQSVSADRQENLYPDYTKI